MTCSEISDQRHYVCCFRVDINLIVGKDCILFCKWHIKLVWLEVLELTWTCCSNFIASKHEFLCPLCFDHFHNSRATLLSVSLVCECNFLCLPVISLFNCFSPVALESSAVAAEPVRSELGIHGDGQQPHGSSEGRAEPAACPASGRPFACTTSGVYVSSCFCSPQT